MATLEIFFHGFFSFTVSSPFFNDVHCHRILEVNPSTAKFFNWNFHPLEVVSRGRDPQRQVGENYPDLTKWR